MRDVETESEAIEDHVFVARVEDFGTFLPRIGDLRKKVMTLMRLLGGKADVVDEPSNLGSVECHELVDVVHAGEPGVRVNSCAVHAAAEQAGEELVQVSEEDASGWLVWNRILVARKGRGCLTIGWCSFGRRAGCVSTAPHRHRRGN